MYKKERIENLLIETERVGIRNLLDWMDENGFYDAPCSSKYHLATPGGLAEHSLNVLGHALDLLEAFYGADPAEINEEFINAIIICSLLHDLGKTGQYGKPNYIMMPGEEPGTITFKGNKDLAYVPHEIRSVAIASQFIDLTEEEQFAILHHNGLYGDLKSIKGNETPLYMIIHFADMWASRVTERED